MKQNKNSKRNIFIFYLLTILIGLLSCIITFSFVFNFFSDKNQSDDNQQKNFVINRPNNFSALINKIDKDSLEIFNINTEINSKIKINSNTKFFDKNNSKITISDLKPGDIINIKSTEGQIDTLSINKNTWTKNRITNFKFDYNLKEFYYNDQKYSFNKNMFIKDDFDIKKINPLSFISIKGLDKNIWFLEVNKGYGSINLLNKNKIINGKIKVDSGDLINLNNIKSKNLPEGPHNIFITGDNIQNYYKSIFINNGDDINIDLLYAQFKRAIVNLFIYPKDYYNKDCVVYIDNKKISLSEPILLNYGEYDLKITKPGYNDFIDKILIDSDIKNINIKLTRAKDNSSIFNTSILPY